MAEDVRALGAKAIVAEVDVRERQQVRRLVDRAIAELGSADIVVANAGIARREPLPESVSDDEWDLILDVNLTGACAAFKPRYPTCVSVAGDGSWPPRRFPARCRPG